MGVDVVIEEEKWAGVGLKVLAAHATSAVFAHVGLSEAVEVAILACNDARIADLNADFRGKPQPTNVLSWPSAERGSGTLGKAPVFDGAVTELGDLAIAYETCLREAEESGLAFEDHVTHLIVHGVLHLLGYDHENEADGDLMESVETAILAKLGVSDPYAVATPGDMSDGKD